MLLADLQGRTYIGRVALSDDDRIVIDVRVDRTRVLQAIDALPPSPDRDLSARRAELRGALERP